jgi:hypothetical protein
MGRSTVKRIQIAAHLIVLAFFFLLRVGEYTRSNEPWLTVPLRKQDVKLWRGGYLIPIESPLPVLLTADAVTICLENQKNGHQNAVLHHTCSGDTVLNPVRAAAVLISELTGLAPNTPLGSFRT